MKEIFDQAISYWPKEISVKDKVLLESGGARIPELTRVHDEVAKNIFKLKNNYLFRQMDWAIYTVLHQAAREVDFLTISEIDLLKVEEIYLENIKD